MSKITVNEDGIIVSGSKHYFVEVDGKILDLTEDNFLPVVWNGVDWVLDKDSFDSEDAYDRAMGVL